MSLEIRLRKMEKEISKLKIKNTVLLITVLVFSGLYLSQAQVSNSSTHTKSSDSFSRIVLLENRVKSLEKEVYAVTAPKSPNSVEDRLSVLEEDVRNLYSNGTVYK